MRPPDLTVGQAATLACLLEVTAPKVGNVHRGADFDDASLNDFVASAVAVGPLLGDAWQRALGETVRDCISATRRVSPTNTNLGAVLLLTPLAMAAGRWDATPASGREPRPQGLAKQLAQVWHDLDAADAANVFAAIGAANPGGLGTTEQMDVSGEPPDDLMAAMRLAADRDLVARQYANSMQDVMHKAAPWIEQGVVRGWPLPASIVHCQLRLMAELGDTLIGRKCGSAASAEASDRAAEALAAGTPGEEAYARALSDLDFWLRSDGRRRNPGATADLIAAGLFVLLWQRRLPPPWG